MGRSLNYRLTQILTYVLASNAIAAMDEYSKHEKRQVHLADDSFGLIKAST